VGRTLEPNELHCEAVFYSRMIERIKIQFSRPSRFRACFAGGETGMDRSSAA